MKSFEVKKHDSDKSIYVDADRYDIINGVYQFYVNESIIFSIPSDNISECKLDGVRNSEYDLLKS